MTWLCLERADLARFAAVTGDCNPLHLDPEFARISTFGQPIAHGVLAAAATLALSGAELTSIIRLAIDFSHPVLPGLRYHVPPTSEGAALRLGDTTVLSIRWAAGKPVPAPKSAAVAGVNSGSSPLASTAPGHPPTEPSRVLTATQLAGLPAESGRYQPDLPGLHGLLSRITGTSIPDRLAEPLAWASFFAGMRTPGRDALLAGIRLDVTDEGTDPVSPAAYSARVSRFDERTGLVTISAGLHGLSRTELTVSAFLRHRIEPPGPADLIGDLPASGRLAGRTVLAAGASRGLGAALACQLAGQGARVLALSSRQAPTDLIRHAQASQLAVDWVRCDACDAGRLGEVLGGLPLDGLVLAAGPRVVGLPLSPETVRACAAHVEEALRLALTPLAVAAPNLRDEAFVLFISSQAVSRSQRLWPHYVAAKAALEGLAGHTAQHHPSWRVAVARPPRLRTEMANGPASAPGALAPGIAASCIVAHVLAGPATPGEVRLIDAAAFPVATTAQAP